jgi:hypothetical protein
MVPAGTALAVMSAADPAATACETPAPETASEIPGRVTGSAAPAVAPAGMLQSVATVLVEADLIGGAPLVTAQRETPRPETARAGMASAGLVQAETV